MKRQAVRIDVGHTLELLAGKRVAIKVPAGVEVIEIALNPAAIATNGPDDFTKLCDVFFNGRKA